MPENEKSTYLFEGSNWLFSLNKLVGKRVVDILGYPSRPFKGDPVFVISQIVFEDGVTIHIGGEHDTAYIPSSEHLQNMDEKTLQRFCS